MDSTERGDVRPMSLAGQVALVLGATGNVGHGAAQALLDAGARVLAPTRTEAGAEALREAFTGRALAPIVGDVSDPAGAEALRDAVRAHGPVDHVVASLGGWWAGGPIAGQPAGEWSGVRAMLLDGQVHAAAVFLPELAGRAAASYTLITGAGALQLMPRTSMLFVATNGVLALSRVLREEHRAGPVRVNELLIATRVEKTPRPVVVPAAVFGRAVVAIAGSDVRSQVLRYDGPDAFALPA